MASPVKESPVKLAKPGAGLPWLERVVAKYMIKRKLSRKMSWDDADAFFLRETDKILKRVEGLSDEVMITPVLIDRIQGMEDSSRFWSPAMTMEHLMMTAPHMADIVIELSHGRVPVVRVTVADVKPRQELAAGEARQEFKKMAERVQARLKTELGNRESPTTLAHPWFGPFTARQWHWLLGGHQIVHRRQIEAILNAPCGKSRIL